MNLEIFTQTLLVIISVCGAIYGMMKFLLRDIVSRLNLIDEHIKEIKEENKSMERRAIETNKRMDGVYNLILRNVNKDNS